MSNGFLLVELLMVVGILLIVLSSTLLFLTAILKGVNQANVTAEVKQNGQVILDSLDRQIRNARSVECKNSVGTPVACTDSSVSTKYLKLIRRNNSDPMHIKCFNDGAVPKSQNGSIGIVVSTTENPLDSSYGNITNNALIAGVDIQNCNFMVVLASSGVTAPPIVSVSFVVNQGINAPSRADFLANVQFQTTISLRNY